MVRLLVLFPPADRAVAPDVREAARRLSGLQGLLGIYGSLRIEPVGGTESRYGRVVELDFTGPEALRRALEAGRLSELLGAAGDHAPSLHAFSVRTLALGEAERLWSETTDVDVAEGESAEPEPDDPLDALIELPTLRRAEADGEDESEERD
jgi:hypothetical protein